MHADTPGILEDSSPALWCPSIPKLMGLPHFRANQHQHPNDQAEVCQTLCMPQAARRPHKGLQCLALNCLGLALTSASLGKESSTSYEGFAFIWAEAGCGKGEGLRALYKLFLIALGSGSKLDPYLSLWTYENRMLGVLVPKDLAKLMLNKKKKK